MNKVTLITLFILACSFASLQKSHAQIPRTISFQGVLADGQGNLVPDGNHHLQIILYDQATGGNQVFIENQTVPVVKGIFNVIIGSVAAIPQSLSFDRAYFLGVSVDGGSELTPRNALTSVPYALRAERANIAEALSSNAAVVTRMNNQSGDVTLLGAGGTTITNNGNAFTISSTGTGGTGIQSMQSTDGTISIQNPNGPVATIGLNDGAVTDSKLAAGQVVKSINTLKDDVTLTAGSNVTITPNGNALTISATGGGSSGVSSINNANGAITLAASGGATVSTNGKTITINAGSGSGGTGIQGIQNTDNALDVTNPGGPTATINVKNQGITTTKLADGSVTNAKIQTGQVVRSINTIKDDVTLAAGNNITVIPSGNTLTIAATGGGTNYWSANGNDISNTNSGNVGIGTTSPQAKLVVNGETRLTPGGSGGTINFGTPNAETGMTISGNSNNSRADMRFDGQSLKLLAGTGLGPPLLENGIVITTSGNVGIGKTDPFYKLQVEGTGSAVVEGRNSSSNNYGFFGGIDIGVYGNSYTGKAVYGFSNNTGIGVQGYSALGFGVKCEGNGCYTGSWTNCSDLRMKKDIVPLRDALSNLLKLRGVYYYWRKDEFPDEHFFPTRQIGVIAQEVEPLFPELVVTDSKGYKSVDYIKLTPILLEAIKEQQKTIDTLTKANQTFNERLTQLEKRVGQTTMQTNLTSLDINK